MNSGCRSSESDHQAAVPEELKEFFSPPEEFRKETGKYSSHHDPQTEEWEARREEILEKWHKSMGS
jgi:hypothetical protein